MVLKSISLFLILRRPPLVSWKAFFGWGLSRGSWVFAAGFLERLAPRRSAGLYTSRRCNKQKKWTLLSKESGYYNWIGCSPLRNLSGPVALLADFVENLTEFATAPPRRVPVDAHVEVLAILGVGVARMR